MRCAWRACFAVSPSVAWPSPVSRKYTLPAPPLPPHHPTRPRSGTASRHFLSNTSRNVIADCGKWCSGPTMAGQLDAYTNSCSAAANSISTSCMLRASGPLHAYWCRSFPAVTKSLLFFCNRLICFQLNHFVASRNILSLSLRFGHIPVVVPIFPQYKRTKLVPAKNNRGGKASQTRVLFSVVKR